MGNLPERPDYNARAVHESMLHDILVDCSPQDSLVYSYGKSFNGFAAWLTLYEKEMIEKMKGVAIVFESQTHHPATTRSWDYLQLPRDATRKPTTESNLVVAVMDTGIWPDLQSFSDEGFGPPPMNWRGSCQKIACNNKIVGAKAFYSGNETLEISPLDTEGHGTHTASTVAGRETTSNFFGLADGVARGGTPLARIAVYKVCWQSSSGDSDCSDKDILAAFDEAISDGVDAISVSLSSPLPINSITIGSFHALKRSILTSAAGGNEGPKLNTISNFAPWILTVAATTMDRQISVQLDLGDGRTLTGKGINIYNSQRIFYPIVYEGAASVAGKIVIYDSARGASNGQGDGRVGAILVSEYKDCSYSLPLPGMCINKSQGIILKGYVLNTENAIGKLYKSDTTFNQNAPMVPYFSSRGPSYVFRDIMKPDISAPGVEILASWPPKVPLSDKAGDDRFSDFNIISGTSMACPHATGAALYLKTFHPSWSPSAIKSALMTTASFVSAESTNELELAYGAGQINPTKALCPGLVYDADFDDHVRFICAQNNSELLKFLSDDNITCNGAFGGATWDLNYPSFALSGKLNQPLCRIFRRRLTNVGFPVATYTAVVTAPIGMSIEVEPDILKFNNVGDTQYFTVTVEVTLRQNVTSGSIVWVNENTYVRSPIVAYVDSLVKDS